MRKTIFLPQNLTPTNFPKNPWKDFVLVSLFTENWIKLMYWKFPILLLYCFIFQMNEIFDILIIVNYKNHTLSNTLYQIIHFSTKYERLRIIIRVFKCKMNIEYFISVVQRLKKTNVKNHVALLWVRMFCVRIIILSHSFAAHFPRNRNKTNLIVCIIIFAGFFISHDWYELTLYEEKACQSPKKIQSHNTCKILFVNKWIPNWSWLFYSLHSLPLVSHSVLAIHSVGTVRTVMTVARSKYSYAVSKLDIKVEIQQY